MISVLLSPWLTLPNPFLTLNYLSNCWTGILSDFQARILTWQKSHNPGSLDIYWSIHQVYWWVHCTLKPLFLPHSSWIVTSVTTWRNLFFSTTTFLSFYSLSKCWVPVKHWSLSQNASNVLIKARFPLFNHLSYLLISITQVVLLRQHSQMFPLLPVNQSLIPITQTSLQID